MDLTLISQGAEGKIFTCKFLNKPAIKKERISRSYRHPTLDAKIRERRLIIESRTQVKLHKEGIPVPSLLFVDTLSFSIYMEYINPSTSLKSFLISNPSLPESFLNDLSSQIGKNIALMHNAQCIHGDLTTSNMLLKLKIPLSAESNCSLNAADYFVNTFIVYLIDFGLSYASSSAEDFAVDLHVLEKAIGSAHPSLNQLFIEILAEYKKYKKKADAVLTKLEQVRSRGRKRLAFG